MPNVLILGAGSDMAVAIARKFAADGIGVQLAARNINRLKPLQSDLTIRYNSVAPFTNLTRNDPIPTTHS
jgi:decaprenylphospho-beta-D-erythro-pentofuranosid-2-ulose 2-reductase